MEYNEDKYTTTYNCNNYIVSKTVTMIKFYLRW